MKKKKQKYPYKFIRPEELDELRSMKNEDLMLEYMKQSKASFILQRDKKNDSELSKLKKEISVHRNSSSELKEKKEELKDLKKSIDLEIEDLILDKKSLEKGYNDQIKSYKEKMLAIQTILETRKSQ